MADRESVLAWLRESRWRWVRPNHPARKIVEQLVLDGHAELLTPDRFCAVPEGAVSAASFFGKSE